MITKTQALRWKKRVYGGERIPIPPAVLVTWNACKASTPSQIKRELSRARFWGYAGTVEKRLMEMGLLNGDYGLTDLGKEYAA